MLLTEYWKTNTKNCKRKNADWTRSAPIYGTDFMTDLTLISRRPSQILHYTRLLHTASNCLPLEYFPRALLTRSLYPRTNLIEFHVFTIHALFWTSHLLSHGEFLHHGYYLLFSLWFELLFYLKIIHIIHLIAYFAYLPILYFFFRLI